MDIIHNNNLNVYLKVLGKKKKKKQTHPKGVDTKNNQAQDGNQSIRNKDNRTMSQPNKEMVL
jgi:hypothetical protein